MKRMHGVLALVMVVAMVLAACGATPTATPVPPTATPKPAAAAPTATAKPAAPAPTATPAAKSPADIKGKVVVWYDSGAAWNDAIAKINAGFKAIAPNIEIEWVTQDPSQASAKIVAAFAAKQGPDIALGAQGRLTAAEEQFKAWADLTPYMASDKEFAATVAALPESAVNTYKTGAKLWGLPEVVQTVGLFVRKSWLEAAGGKLPTDFEEMTALAKKFTKTGQFGYCIFGKSGTTNGAGTQYAYTAEAAGEAYPMIDTNGKPTFNTDTAIQVAKWLYRWQHTDKITAPDTPNWIHTEFYQAVQAGACGIGRIGAWNVAPWEKSALGTDFVIMNYPPMTKDQKNPALQSSWTNGIVMNGAATNKDATFAFFKYLMSKDVQTIFFPVRTSWARTDLDFAKLFGTNERLLYFGTAQKYAADFYHPFGAPVHDILAKHLNGMLADAKSDPAQVMKAAYDEAMAKYKELGGK